MIRKIAIFALISLLFWMTSCVKYSFKGSLPGYLKTIYIPLFEDKTGYPGTVESITQKIAEKFIEDNTLQVISSKSGADLILSGTLTRIEIKPAVIEQGKDVTENRIIVTVQVECMNTHTQKPLWKGNISKDANYQDDYQNALEEAIELISEEIVNKTIAAW